MCSASRFKTRGRKGVTPRPGREVEEGDTSHAGNTTRIYSANFGATGGEGPLESAGEHRGETWPPHSARVARDIAQAPSSRKMVRGRNPRAPRGLRNCHGLEDAADSGRARNANSAVRSGRMGGGGPLRKAGRRANPSSNSARCAQQTLRCSSPCHREQWKQHGMHAERGVETIEHIVRLMAGHDLNHLGQIERIVAARKS